MGLSLKSIYRFFISCFDNGKVPRSPRKWNLNLLYFLPFIFTFEQCELNSKILQCFDINDIPWKIKAVYQNLQMTQDHFTTIFLLSKYKMQLAKIWPENGHKKVLCQLQILVKSL